LGFLLQQAKRKAFSKLLFLFIAMAETPKNRARRVKRLRLSSGAGEAKRRKRNPVRSALRAVIAIFAYSKANPNWHSQNREFLGLCNKYLKDKKFRTIENALEILAKLHEIRHGHSGQRYFDFG
jgi:hypothetical protein